MDYRELFLSVDLAMIDAWIAEHRGEDLFLDFKTVRRADFSPEDRKTFAKALSGFANSAGGIIVWGVDARPDKETGVDAAQQAAEIDDLPQFLAKLEEFTGAFVRPLVGGVQHRAIPRQGSRGFAITLVPESDSGPHMGMGGEGRYYKRSGAAFYPMEHFDLEDMFGRRKRPAFRMHARMERGGMISGAGVTKHRGKIVLSVENIGRGTARSPYVSFTIMPPYTVSEFGVTGNGEHGLARLPHGGAKHVHRFGASSSIVIYPNTIFDVTAIDVSVSVYPDHRIDKPKPFYVEYEVAAEDLPLSRGVIEFDPAKIIRGVLFGED